MGEVEVFKAGERNDDGDFSPHLHHILQEHEAYEKATLIAALGAVAEQADDSALPYVLTLAGDADEEVRWHVVYALATIGGDEAQAMLVTLARDDPSALVRSFAQSLRGEDGG